MSTTSSSPSPPPPTAQPAVAAVTTTPLYVISATTTRLAEAPKGWKGPHGINHFTKCIVLICVDQHGNTHTVVVKRHSSFVLVKLTGPNVVHDRLTLQALGDAAEDVSTAVMFGRQLRVEPITMTPVVGFTNSRKDTLYRLWFTELGSKYNLIRSIQDNGGVGVTPKAWAEYDEKRPEWLREKQSLKPMPAKVVPARVIHERLRDVNLFLHLNNIQLATWISVPTSCLCSTGSVVATTKHVSIVPSSSIHAISEPDAMGLPPVPPVTLTYVRVRGHSSTTTSSSTFEPDATIRGDYVTHIALCTHRLDRPPTTTKDIKVELLTCTKPEDEKATLLKLRRYLLDNDPSILVQWSDDVNDIRYLHQRSIHHGPTRVSKKNKPYKVALDIGLSTIRGARVRESIWEGKLLDITHYGRVRVDMLPILSRFMTSPPLDGYSMPDVLAHPKLIRDKTECPLPESTMVGVRSSHSAVSLRLEQEMRMAVTCMRDNDFISGQLAISSLCDLELARVCERGQQTRTRNCFMRWYYNESLYVDDETLAKNYVVVRRARAQSSYPDPEWIKNPSMAQFLLKGCNVGVEYLDKWDVPYTDADLEAAGLAVEEKEEDEEKEDERPRKRQRTTAKKKKKKAKKKKKTKRSILELMGGSIKSSRPTKRTKAMEDAEKKSNGEQVTTKKFTGGFVVAPRAQFYHRPWELVCTLDFAALYPSEIQGSRVSNMPVHDCRTPQHAARQHTSTHAAHTVQARTHNPPCVSLSL